MIFDAFIKFEKRLHKLKRCESNVRRAPRWKIWHPEYLTEERSCVRSRRNLYFEWNTPGSSRCYMRWISNGCYRDFLDTKPCR